MKDQLKAFLATKRGKTIAWIALAVFWIVLLSIWIAPSDTLFPDAADLKRKRTELKKLSQENTELTAKIKEFDALKKRYKTMRETVWTPERDGDVETEFRVRVRNAATGANLTVNNLGSVRTSRINPELFYAEIDIQAVGTIEIITDFLRRIAAESPAMGWRRLDLRIGFRPGRGNTADQDSSLMCNGVLRLIGYDGKQPDSARKEATK
ncbi:MAG: hypothetical protein PHS41_04015 [Victivallaceae bacterium]|nr:hypothetical protein [Victivallaceae bacterium]